MSLENLQILVFLQLRISLADQYVEARGVRCAERLGFYPVGVDGGEWVETIAAEAQYFCDNDDACAGIMRYVGTDPMHCDAWCGRPQFCIRGNRATENKDWLAYLRVKHLADLAQVPRNESSTGADVANKHIGVAEQSAGVKEVTCTSVAHLAGGAQVILFSGRSAHDLVPSDQLHVDNSAEKCHVLRLQPDVKATHSHQADDLKATTTLLDFVDGLLTADENEDLRFFTAAKEGQWRYFLEDYEYPAVNLGSPVVKRHFLSLYFLTHDANCPGPRNTSLTLEEAVAELPAHVYVEDGTRSTRRAAFGPYRITLMCGAFDAVRFPPEALIDAIAFAAHPIVPEYFHARLNQVFFHLPDAAQPFRALSVQYIQKFFEEMFSNPEKENMVTFKLTFLFLCQQLLWYRYREPPSIRDETAACALCDGQERMRRRMAAMGQSEALKAAGASTLVNSSVDADDISGQKDVALFRESVAVAFSSMTRRSAHVLRQAVRETWGQLVDKTEHVVTTSMKWNTVLRFFVGAGDGGMQDSDLSNQDVVELPVAESYRVINVKAFLMLEWTFDAFPNLQWLIRLDDDIYLRPAPLLMQLAQRPPVRYLWGNFDHGSRPQREQNHPHYNSFEQMPARKHPIWGDIFPPYARGNTWAMSVDLLGEVVQRWRTYFEHQPREQLLGETLAQQLPHPDDPALGVMLASLVDAGMSLNVDDRDFNSFSLNPSCNSTFSNMHGQTWVVHHVGVETMRCMWATDSVDTVGASGFPRSRHAFPDLCSCSIEVAEEEDPMENGTPFWYPKNRFNT